ncbi:hypothetical protein ACFWPU_36550 [Streptomyces sp. NPDC058471]|uniref:zinc finger domain-containing protein n=1 Tax=Streptomyces sp. NPDC058471 TaxID=3346516 RepID=UPI0036523C13
MVVVAGHRYQAIPVDADEEPLCDGCSAPLQAPWRIGRALDLRNPHLCGQPKKSGEPCRWDITREPCRVHLSHEDQERERMRQEAEAERRKELEEQRQRQTEERRLGLISILSVACPHCLAPAAALCRSRRGSVTRPLHRARRQLAGVPGPKEFVIEATSFHRLRVPEPPLDGDLRALLDDPLLDRTAQTEQRFAAEQHEAAQRKMDEAQRDLWLAADSREDVVRAQPCPACDAAPGAACQQFGKPFRRRWHAERIDAAMACSAIHDDVPAM